MNILLAHAYFLKDDRVERHVMKPYPPLGLLYVSGFLQDKNVEHHLFDGTFSSFDAVQEAILESRPDILALYVNFLTRLNVVRIVEWARGLEKLSHTRIVLGGPDVRFHVEEYLDVNVDFLVLGEGEITFYELLTALGRNAGLAEVKGIAYRNEEGRTVFTGERPMEQDLSVFPWPNRSKTDVTRYMQSWKQHHGYSSLTISTQRGCPFTCTWCSHAVYGDTYRRRKVEDVVKEIAFLKQEYNPDHFWFVDDVFTMSERWLQDFAGQLSSQGLHIRYECITRADRMNEEVLKALKASGCAMLWIGAESGSQKILDLMDRRVKAGQVREMIMRAREMGIRTGTFIMLGYPGEDEDDIEETISHLVAAGPDQFTINTAYPIRGTRFYEEVEPVMEQGRDWKTTPDRDLKFRRKYSDRYYALAIRKVYNEVYAHRERRNGLTIKYWKYKLKAKVADAGMKLLK